MQNFVVMWKYEKTDDWLIQQEVFLYVNTIKFSNIYPELDGESLRNQIAKSYKINSKQIILGAGSDEVLQMIYAAFSRPNDEVIFTKYAFAMYSISILTSW